MIYLQREISSARQAALAAERGPLEAKVRGWAAAREAGDLHRAHPLTAAEQESLLNYEYATAVPVIADGDVSTTWGTQKQAHSLPESDTFNDDGTIAVRGVVTWARLLGCSWTMFEAPPAPPPPPPRDRDAERLARVREHLAKEAETRAAHAERVAKAETARLVAEEAARKDAEARAAETAKPDKDAAP